MRSDTTPQWMIDQGLSKTLAKRFWRSVNISGNCWLWTRATDTWGYGRIYQCNGIGVDHSILSGTHQVSWMLHYGPIPEGMCVLHKCDNPPCVRPHHLFLGTFQTNVLDMMAKGRFRAAPRKLSDEDIECIRQLGNELLQREIAEAFGISRPYVSTILSHRRRSNVGGPIHRPAD